MKRTLFAMAVLFCLLAISNQVSAQFIVHPNGNAELGEDCFDPQSIPSQYLQWLDTVTVLRIFGRYDDAAAGGHMTFGDTYLFNTYNVAIGELGYTDSDRLWLQGKFGTYVTAGGNAQDTIMYYDPARANAVKFNKDVHTSGVFVQSDERFKENIEPVGDVLLSLENLEAVTYTLKNNNARCRAVNDAMPALTDKARQDKEFFDRLYAAEEQGSERYGFLAQNVQEVFPELVHTDNAGYMYVDYIGLIPILVQSINELSAKLAVLESEKSTDEPSVPMLQAPTQSGQDELKSGLTDARLYQNAPNPWSSETVISYCLPPSVSTADIYIYDMQGTQLMRIPAQGRGESQVTLTARDLNAGMYLYALVADGALVDSKRMILTK